MAKKQTRRSISVSRTTYERLKAFCETNHISMSQLVETRVNDFLGPNDAAVVRPEPAIAPGAMSAPRAPSMPATSTFSAPTLTSQRPLPPSVKPSEPRPNLAAAPTPAPAAQPPMTSAAARFAVDPPPPIIKPRQETAAPKPAEKRPDQIFTF
jgi:hypothetical protein